MKISEGNKKIIVQEFRYIAKKIKQTENNEEKLYYFSGSQGMVSRILNIEFDLSLIFIHHILQTAHGTLSNTLKSIISGQERVIKLPENLFERLAKELQQLSNEIEKDKDFYSTLANISVLAYVGTGNGYYLYQKGLLKI